MTKPTIPELPSLSNKTTFLTLAQAFFVWLTTTFIDWIDSIATAMNFNSTNDTSATSLLIGTGSKSLTVSPNKSFVGGMYVVLADTAAPSTNSMVAQVTSYNSTTGALVVNATTTTGSGTKTAWTISQTAKPSDVFVGNPAFQENDNTVLSSYTIPTGKNAVSAGPMTVPVGVVVTVPVGSTWVVV